MNAESVAINDFNVCNGIDGGRVTPLPMPVAAQLPSKAIVSLIQDDHRLVEIRGDENPTAYQVPLIARRDHLRRWPIEGATNRGNRICDDRHAQDDFGFRGVLLQGFGLHGESL